jgi:hypothetical protein
MARPPSVDPLQKTILDLGRHIGQQLAEAITSGFSEALETRGPRAPGRPRGSGAAAPSASASSESACKVPSCGRKSAAKGLCQNHYGKARRLKMDPDALSPSQLTTLGQDGRAQRRLKSAGR